MGVLLITALCSVLSSGGSNTLASASLIGGMMIAYVLDAMRYREGSFLAVWATLLVTNVGLGYGLVVEAMTWQRAHIWQELQTVFIVKHAPTIQFVTHFH